MREIGIDIETYSSADLKTCGVYRYAEAADFAVLLFSYSVDNGPVACVDIASGEELPDDIRAALTDPSIIKTAFNATFERICLSRFLNLPRFMDPAQWRCTMVAAARMGFPLSLARCAEALKIEQGKMTEGGALIRYFSKPGIRGIRHMPSDAPDRWETFKLYNIRDVEVEQAVLAKVRCIEPAPFDDLLYTADQEINDRGVRIDTTLAANAARMDDEFKAEIIEEAKRLTGLENPNSLTQLKAWIRRQTGFSVESLDKKAIDDLEQSLRFYPKVRRVLQLRRMLGKTSVKKYSAMLESVCADNRIHGLLQFYGAARTGRWAGRLVQVQNLPQNHIPDLDLARSLVRNGDLEELEMNYANVPQVLSELIRTAFIAAPSHTFHVCDFSAIEARVIAWLAGESWVLDVFRQGGDIYCSTASRMFGVPVEKHGANAELRQKGKVAVLALGYGGGVAALEAMGGSRLGLDQNEEKEIVRLWRSSNPRIVRLWSIVERAAISAIKTGKAIPINRGIIVTRRRGGLCIILPSGRTMYYPRAAVTLERNDDRRGDHDSIEYEGVDQTTKRWGKIRTYGGKLTENIVQAIARDILADVILRARSADLKVVFHIHDEIVVEAPTDSPLADVAALFSVTPDWCKDLPLKGAGYSTPYYLKD